MEGNDGRSRGRRERSLILLWRDRFQPESRWHWGCWNPSCCSAAEDTEGQSGRGEPLYLKWAATQQVFFSFFFSFFLSFFLFFPPIFRAANQCSRWSTPQPQQYQIRAASATYTTAQANAESLTHWAMPGIELTTSWFLVGFISPEPQWELHNKYFLMGIPRTLVPQQVKWCSVPKCVGVN